MKNINTGNQYTEKLDYNVRQDSPPKFLTSRNFNPEKWKKEKKEEKQYFNKHQDEGLIEYVQKAVPGVKEISPEKYRKYTGEDLNDDLKTDEYGHKKARFSHSRKKSSKRNTQRSDGGSSTGW